MERKESKEGAELLHSIHPVKRKNPASFAAAVQAYWSRGVL
jgi:hypothetical protein